MRITATEGTPQFSQEQVTALFDELNVASDSNLIGVLQDVQERVGWLPAELLQEISRRTRVKLSRVYGVVSFYAQFYTEPRGRHTVRLCNGTACHVRGGGRCLEAAKRYLGIQEAESTPDLDFYLETVACLGTCFLAPVMMVDDEYFGQLTPSRVETILKGYRRRES